MSSIVKMYVKLSKLPLAARMIIIPTAFFTTAFVGILAEAHSANWLVERHPEFCRKLLARPKIRYPLLMEAAPAGTEAAMAAAAARK